MMDYSCLRQPHAFFNAHHGVDESTIKVPLNVEHTFALPNDDVEGLAFMESSMKNVDAQKKQHDVLASNSVAPSSLPYAQREYTHASHPGIKMNHGTTTMAFLFDGGVLVAVDSRASMGSYIGSGTVKKVIKISKYLLGTMAGGAADCSFWERVLAQRVRLHELEEESRISVCAASKMLANMVYQYRGMGLSMGTMVAGFDETEGASLYYVDDDGTRLKGERFCVGSGATYAYGVLDNEYRKDLTVDEAVALGKRAIWHATHRDAYSGGTINVFVITKDGWTQHYKGDMNELYYDQGYKDELEKYSGDRVIVDEDDDEKMDD